MATLLRAFARHRHAIFTRLPNNSNKIAACNISTTDKKKGVIDATKKSVSEKSDELKQLEEQFADGDPSLKKNWISYGMDLTDRKSDNFIHDLALFTGVASFFVCCYLYAYFPDFKLNDWAVREAYLELDRREREGLPLIDPNYVPPENIPLPTEEDLMDKEVVV